MHDMKALDEASLLRLYMEVLNAMKERKMIRSANAITGDLGERFVSERLGLNLVSNSVKGYDAEHADGTKYQIKTRRITRSNRLDNSEPSEISMSAFLIIVLW